jgi:2-polyprenyl-6-methoxyphenol hydroxylase-like FAD-dependent oxidoreductase
VAGATYGWGVVFWDDLRESLHLNDPASAKQIDKVALRWEDLVVDFNDISIADEGTGYSITRRALLSILVERAEAVGVRVEFAHPVIDRHQIANADLVVAADGANSSLRSSDPVFGTAEHIGRNKYVWLGATKVFGSFTFPFVESDYGWIWAHAYGSSSDSSTVVIECPPETWTRLGFEDLPVRDSLTLLDQLFARHLDGGRLMVQGNDLPTLPWANFRRITNERWHDGQLALVGDAAHTTHFTIGSGTRLAIEDAIALADHLDEDANISAALDGYEVERKQAIAIAQTDAEFSAAWFENIERYVELGPRRFVSLLHARRSPVIAQRYGSSRDSS